LEYNIINRGKKFEFDHAGGTTKNLTIRNNLEWFKVVENKAERKNIEYFVPTDSKN